MTDFEAMFRAEWAAAHPQGPEPTRADAIAWWAIRKPAQPLAESPPLNEVAPVGETRATQRENNEVNSDCSADPIVVQENGPGDLTSAITDEPALPLIAVLDRYATGFEGPESSPDPINYMALSAAFEDSHDNDAHFVQYSCPDFPHRINQAALEHLKPGAALQMAFYGVDVDAPDHKPTEEWRQAEREKIERLCSSSLAPLYWYETKGGYRLVWLLPGPFELKSKADVAQWRSFYLSGLRYLARVFGIQGDEACADPTRVFRLPRVVRDGVRQEMHRSEINVKGVWSPTWAPEDIVPVETVAMSETANPLYDIPDAPVAVVAQTHDYVAAIPGAIEGHGGDKLTYQVACECKRRGLSEGQAINQMREFNTRCQPPWREAELQHKVKRAYGDETAVFDERAKDAAMVGDVLAKVTPRPSGFSGCAEHPFDGLTGDDIFADSEPIDLVVPELDVGVGRPTGFVGLGNSKKTIAAMQMALDVSQGRPVWGRFPVNRARKVLYLDYESGPITREKMRRMAKGAKLKGSDLQGKLEICIEPNIYLESPEASEALERKIRDGGFELCIVDSLCQCNPFVDENTAKASEPLKYMKHISVKTGCAFVVVHHARKPQPDGKPGDQNMVRGHSSIFNTMGSVLLFRAGEDKNSHSIVKHDRAYNTGRTIEDFALEVKDTWATPLADCAVEQGLCVSCKDLGIVKDQEAAAVEAAKIQRNKRHFDKLKDEIMVEVSKAPDGTIPGVNALQAVLGRKKEDLSGALEQLESEGRIIMPAVKRGHARPIMLRPPGGDMPSLNMLNKLSGALS